MPILIQVLLNISKKKNIVHIDRQYTLLNIGWLYIYRMKVIILTNIRINIYVYYMLNGDGDVQKQYAN